MCGASTLVRVDGKLRRHKRHPKGTQRLMVACDGSEKPPAPSLRSAYRKLTRAELVAEAQQLFGDDPKTYAFKCPHCGDVASIGEFLAEGLDAGRAGQECIGRQLGATTPTPTNKRGCDWAAYGLFHGPWEIVMPAEDNMPERTAWSFALAGAVSE